MQILQQPISKETLRTLAQNTFGDMIKCVADVKEGLLALDADLHADLERMLLEKGSAQENLWGFNLWVEEEGEDFIEFDSLINIRSWQGNPSRDIEDPEVRERKPRHKRLCPFPGTDRPYHPVREAGRKPVGPQRHVGRTLPFPGVVLRCLREA